MKSFKIIISGKRDKELDFNNLDEAKAYFSYTLEIGRSWNKKIKHITDIKTPKSFVSNLQKSYEAKEACCYDRTNVSLA